MASNADVLAKADANLPDATKQAKDGKEQEPGYFDWMYCCSATS